LIKERKKLMAFLDRISTDICYLYGDLHISTILHGGIVLREFSPAFSDIDLIVVLKRVTEGEAYAWGEAWEQWLTHPFGEKVWVHLLSIEQLQGIPSTGWTISKMGVQPFFDLPIDEMELHTLLNHGKTLCGDNIIGQFPALSKDYSFKGLEKFLRILQKYSGVSPLQPYRTQLLPDEDEISVALTFPRHLYNLKTGDILTKCQAARWYAREKLPFASGLLKVAKYRMNPDPGEANAVLRVFDKMPSLLTHFWQAYFKELRIDITIPHPIVTPVAVHYGSTFMAIQEGLQLANDSVR
jgi:hypothetical protein